MSFRGQPQVTRRDSMRSSSSTQRPATDILDGPGQQQQFSDWQSSPPSSSQLQARSDSETAGAAAAGGLHSVREPSQLPNKSGGNLLLTVPAPNPNSLAPSPPPQPAPSHSPLSRSYVTLAIPEECAADVPLLRSRFPVRRPDDANLAGGPVGPVNTLDVRIEASVKRKT